MQGLKPKSFFVKLPFIGKYFARIKHDYLMKTLKDHIVSFAFFLYEGYV